MRINAAYKEGLKKILETGDASRVEVSSRPFGVCRDECADCVVYGAYLSKLSCFAFPREKERELADKVGAAIKGFLELADVVPDWGQVSGDAMFALTEWQKAYKECMDAQSDTSTSRDGTARVPGADER